MPGGWSASECRQSWIWPLELYVTMTIDRRRRLDTGRLCERRQHSPGAVGPRIAREDAGARRENALTFGGIENEALEHLCNLRGIRPRDVESGVAARLARDRRIEQQRRQAGGERFEWRQAEPLVLGQEGERAGGAIQLPQFVVRYIRAHVNTVADWRRVDDGAEIDVWRRAIVADDVEVNAGARARQLREAFDQLGDMTPVEDRAHVENSRAAG